MGELRSYLRGHGRELAAALALAVVAAGVALAQPLAAMAVVDGLSGPSPGTARPVLVLTLLVVVGAVATGLESWLLARTAERVVVDVRTRLAQRLLRLRVSELDARQPGELVSRVTADTTLLRGATTTALVGVVTGVIGVVGAFVLMATLDLRLLGATAAVLAVVIVASRLVMPRIRAATVRAQDAVGRVGAALDRALGAARTVKAAGAERAESDTVAAAARSACDAGVDAARWSAVLSVVNTLSNQVAFLTVLGIGGAFVVTGSMTVSVLIAFLLYLFYLSGPISQLTQGVTTIQQGLGAAARLREVEEMSVEDAVDPEPGSAASSGRADAPALRLRSVTFGYRTGEPVLVDVDLDVPAGQRTALVGPSGAGKSTLFSLLQRFHEPDGGRIEMDGTEIGTIPRRDVRAAVGWVEQDSPVLSGTLRDNICYGVPEPSPGALERVLHDTRLDELVAGLPDGLDTPVGPRGVTLSGGERQRTAIARALLRGPRLLLLDEATAHLDARNEIALQDTLSRVARSCTVLVIAHRLATVVDAERIVVLERGRVRAVGRHAELLHTDTLYRELATAQLACAAPDPVTAAPLAGSAP